MNLVLDEVDELLRGDFPPATPRPHHGTRIDCVDPEDGALLFGQTRRLGLVVCRGPTIVLISPTDGVEEIENPFAVQQ